MSDKTTQSQSVLGELQPSKAIVKLAVPATLALLAKAVYNIVDTAYIGMLNSDIALTAVGVTVPLLLIMVSIENIFAAGAAVLAGRQLGQQDHEAASRTVTTIIGLSVMLTVLVAAAYIALSKPLILLFNRNPVIIGYGAKLLISQVALYPAFGLCYMMTTTFQTIGASRYGLFLSAIRQGLFYIPFILTLPKLLGVTGIYFSQPAADILTILVCVCSIRAMKRIATERMGYDEEGREGENLASS